VCKCANNMRQLGVALRLYADQHEGTFPRSQHSAFASGEQPWGLVLADTLDGADGPLTNYLHSVFHCPSDSRTVPWSYGLNVYFELDPANDDYAGSPRTWRCAESVPSPGRTIWLAEVPGAVDHVMAHFWASPSDCGDVAAARHSGRANYLFVDGHIECLRLEETYDPTHQVDRWNPSSP